MKKQLVHELCRQTGLSVVIYAVLFAVLFAVEYFVPALRGTLLKWSDPAFVVGIPASVIGTAYVLTIKNPNNYLGFYFGIVMSLLLAVQFYLQGQYEFVVLYTVVFVPFMIRSIVSWRKASETVASEPLVPSFVSRKYFRINICLFLLLCVADYAFATYMSHEGWGDNVLLKIAGASLLASSVFANFWLMYKSNDAWIFWVIYSLSGMVLFGLIGNIFSLVLFVMFLLINGSAQVAWLKMTDDKHRGWTDRLSNKKQ